jgi:hypothetical protein
MECDPALACERARNRHLLIMCRRVIQSGELLRYGIVEGMDMRDRRAHNYPSRWNAATSQDLLVIRRNHHTGAVSISGKSRSTHSARSYPVLAPGLKTRPSQCAKKTVTRGSKRRSR